MVPDVSLKQCQSTCNLLVRVMFGHRPEIPRTNSCGNQHDRNDEQNDQQRFSDCHFLHNEHLISKNQLRRIRSGCTRSVTAIPASVGISTNKTAEHKTYNIVFTERNETDESNSCVLMTDRMSEINSAVSRMCILCHNDSMIIMRTRLCSCIPFSFRSANSRFRASV